MIYLPAMSVFISLQKFYTIYNEFFYLIEKKRVIALIIIPLSTLKMTVYIKMSSMIVANFLKYESPRY